MENNNLIPKQSQVSLVSYLKNNNEIALIQLQSSLKIDSAINGTSIAKIKKESPEDAAIAIQRLISNLSKSFNLGNTINNAQLLEMSLLLMEKYYYLKIEELAYIFKNAKLGQYGKVYNRLDIQIICEWIEAYLVSEERIGLIEKEAQEYKKKDNTPVSDKTREKIREIYERLGFGTPEQPKENIFKNPPPSHELFMTRMREIIPKMKIEELQHFRSEAVGKAYKEVIEIIEDEMLSRYI